MVRFLTGKGLLSLVSFAPSPAADDAAGGIARDFAAVDVGSILAALKQTPSYQVDKHHTNCGLRTRLLPILEYVQSMLSSNTVPLTLAGWKKDAASTSWRQQQQQRRQGTPAGDGAAPGRGKGKGKGGKKDFDTGKVGKDKDWVFRFTRSVATDQRLRYEGAMAADGMARQLFLAEEWDWTPEEDAAPGGSLGREFATTKVSNFYALPPAPRYFPSLLLPSREVSRKAEGRSSNVIALPSSNKVGSLMGLPLGTP